MNYLDLNFFIFTIIKSKLDHFTIKNLLIQQLIKVHQIKKWEIIIQNKNNKLINIIKKKHLITIKNNINI